MTTPRPPERISDEELVLTCNEGTAAEATRAFEMLYRRHKDFVLRVALRFVRDHDSALDVLQETFTYLLRKFPPAGDGLVLNAKLTTLLYPVAKNSAITQLRRADRAAGRGAPDPDELPAAAAADHSDLAGLLRDLDADRREVILLRFVDGLTLQDIADALQIPLGTVKSRLHLAIRTLRDSPEVKEFFDP